MHCYCLAVLSNPEILLWLSIWIHCSPTAVLGTCAFCSCADRVTAACSSIRPHKPLLASRSSSGQRTGPCKCPLSTSGGYLRVILADAIFPFHSHASQDLMTALVKSVLHCLAFCCSTMCCEAATSFRPSLDLSGVHLLSNFTSPTLMA